MVETSDLQVCIKEGIAMGPEGRIKKRHIGQIGEHGTVDSKIVGE